MPFWTYSKHRENIYTPCNICPLVRVLHSLKPLCRLVPTARPLELVFCSVSPSVMYFEHTPLQNSQGALYALYEALRALDSFGVYAIHKIPTELGAKYISPEGLILPPEGGIGESQRGDNCTQKSP